MSLMECSVSADLRRYEAAKRGDYTETEYDEAMRAAMVRNYNRYRYYNALEPIIEAASNNELATLRDLLERAIAHEGAEDSDADFGAACRKIAERYLRAGAEAAL